MKLIRQKFSVILIWHQILITNEQRNVKQPEERVNKYILEVIHPCSLFHVYFKVYCNVFITFIEIQDNSLKREKMKYGETSAINCYEKSVFFFPLNLSLRCVCYHPKECLRFAFKKNKLPLS